jgi:hypothetical protein
VSHQRCASLTCDASGLRDYIGRVSEPAVVVGDRLDPRTAAPANLAVPGTREPPHRLADEDLDGVRTSGGFGQIRMPRSRCNCTGSRQQTGRDTVTPRSSEPAGEVPPGLGLT